MKIRFRKIAGSRDLCFYHPANLLAHQNDNLHSTRRKAIYFEDKRWTCRNIWDNQTRYLAKPRELRGRYCTTIIAPKSPSFLK